jgi:hypothetical protein
MNQLCESEIWKLARKNGIDLQGIYAKDQLPTHCHGKYVINMQSSTHGNGTHWICLDGHKKKYFDSYGQSPPVEIVQFCPDVKYNDEQYQAMNSSCCGYFCLYFLKGLPLNKLETDPNRLWINDGIVLKDIKK